MLDGDGFVSKPSYFRIIQLKLRMLIDSTIPYAKERWSFCALLACLYVLRVMIWPGFFVVTYVLGIFALNMFIGFLSPKITPVFADEGDLQLPISDEEFRPFIRKLPEFHFWLSLCVAISISLICTCFSVFDLPVYWPVLLFYFVILFFITMRERIEHMIKYNYLPFNMNKKRYHTSLDAEN